MVYRQWQWQLTLQLLPGRPRSAQQVQQRSSLHPGQPAGVPLPQWYLPLQNMQRRRQASRQGNRRPLLCQSSAHLDLPVQMHPSRQKQSPRGQLQQSSSRRQRHHQARVCQDSLHHAQPAVLWLRRPLQQSSSRRQRHHQARVCQDSLHHAQPAVLWLRRPLQQSSSRRQRHHQARVCQDSLHPGQPAVLWLRRPRPGLLGRRWHNRS